MSMRIFSAAALLLAACAGEPAVVQPEGRRIECMLPKGSAMRGDCIVDEAPDGTMTIYDPNGGFRRFERRDGVLHTADGAEEAVVLNRRDGATVIEVGGNHYVLR